jgi:hypothetical protein
LLDSGRFGRVGLHQHRQLAEGNVQAMVEQVEPAAGSTAKA